jgi:hypothetical protein
MYNIHAVREMQIEEIKKEDEEITKKLIDAVFQWWYQCVGEDEFVSLQIKWSPKQFKYIIVAKYKEYYTQDKKLKTIRGKAQFLY